MTEHHEHPEHPGADATPEPTDDAVRSLLRGAVDGSSGPADARAELATLRPRFERARRRREAGVAGSMLAAAAVTAIVVLSTAGGGTGRAQQVDVAGSDGGPTSTTAVEPSTTDAPSSSVATTTSVVAAPTTEVPGDPASTVPSDGSVAPRPTVSSGPATTAAPATAPPSTVPPAPITQVLDSDGGTATVRWTPTSIAVLSTAPAAGWTVEEVKQESATRVVVKFRRDTGGPGSSSAAIDARVVGGELRVDS